MRFILKTLLAFILGGSLVFSVLAFRLWHEQSMVDAYFTLPPGTEVLCLGNSHTGETWSEGTEFRNRKLSCSSSTTFYSLIRLKEMERRGLLGSVRTVIADLDTAGLRYEKEVMLRTYLEQLPFAWRYALDMPLDGIEFLSEPLSRLGYRWVYDVGNHDIPPRDVKVKRYVDRSSDEREAMHRADFDITNPNVLRVKDWQEVEKGVIREMVQICRAHGIRLIFFASPLTKRHIDRPRDGVPDKLAPWFDFVYGLNVEYYDLRAELPDECFNDTNHVLLTQQESFTRKKWKDWRILQ